jgi:hypothetical protein
MSQEQPMRFYAQNTSADNITQIRQVLPKGMAPIEFIPEECQALKRLLYVLEIAEKPFIFLNLSPNQTKNETEKRNCAVALDAFRKILAAQPGSLEIDESRKVIIIPNETRPHLIEVIKEINSLEKKVLQGKATATSSPSAKFTTPGGSSWADVTSWPSPITPELQQRKTLAIEALNEIAKVIPETLKSNYKGRSVQLFPSKESYTIFVGLIYFELQMHLKEILHRASNELKPYLDDKKIELSSSNKEPIFVLVIKDPDKYASLLKDCLKDYVNQCQNFEIESLSPKK